MKAIFRKLLPFTLLLSLGFVAHMADNYLEKKKRQFIIDNECKLVSVHIEEETYSCIDEDGKAFKWIRN